MEEGGIDVMQGMFYLPERDLKFDFTQAHTIHHYVSIVPRGEGDPPADLEDLAGKRIVVQRRDAAHDFLVGKGLGGARFRLPRRRKMCCVNWPKENTTVHLRCESVLYT
jgi:ABC-type amino acid transport substrate-binding protein